MAYRTIMEQFISDYSSTRDSNSEWAGPAGQYFYEQKQKFDKLLGIILNKVIAINGCVSFKELTLDEYNFLEKWIKENECYKEVK